MQRYFLLQYIDIPVAHASSSDLKRFQRCKNKHDSRVAIASLFMNCYVRQGT